MQTLKQRIVRAHKRYDSAVALTQQMLAEAKAGGSYAAYKLASDEEYKAKLKLDKLLELQAAEEH